MKMRMRVLSILICLALLLSTAPADLRLSAGYASEAEAAAEIAEDAAVVEEAEAESPEAIPEAEQDPPEQEGEQTVPEAATPDDAEHEAGDAASAPAEDAGDAPEEIPEAPEASEAEEDVAEPPAEAEVRIDYTADAGASPDFLSGYAEVIRENVAVYDGALAGAEAKAELGKGVVYVIGRAADEHRLNIAYNAGKARGLDEGWVDESALRPMEPEREVPAFVAFCEDLDGVIYPEKLAGLPLARISCTYYDESAEEQESAEEDEQPEPEQPEDEHPLISDEAPEEDTEAEPLPEEDAAIPPEPEADTIRVEGERQDALPVISLRSDALNLGIGESFDLVRTGFVSCSADEGAKVKLGYAVTEGDCAIVSPEGVVMGTSAGEAVITVTEENSGTNARLRVIVQAAATGVTIRESLTLSMGMVADLNVRFPEGSYSTYSLSVEPEGVVELSPSGKVTAIAPGSATITIRTNSGCEDTCYVTVVSETVEIRADESITLALGEEDRRVEARAYAGEVEIPCEFNFAVRQGQENLRVDAATGLLTPLNLGSATVVIGASGARSAECAVSIVTAPTSVTLRSAQITLGVGDRYQISDGEGGIVVLSPGSHISSYRYISSDAGCVSVDDNGLLTAKSEGSATITIRPSGMSDPLYLGVSVVKAAESINLSESEIVLRPGESHELRVSFPSGTYSSYTLSFGGSADEEEEESPISIIPGSDDRWTLQASAMVDGGAILPLIAKAESGATASCVVKLLPGPTEDEIELELTKDTLGIGEPGGKIVARIADGAIAESGFTYKSTNERVLSVDAQGNLTANSVSGDEGATIIATATVAGPDGYASVESDPITVVSYPTVFEFNPGKETLRLGVGDSYALRLGEPDGDPDGIMNIGPSGARTTYSYALSSGSSVGAVSDDGVITAKKAGTMRVQITPASGANVSPKTLKVEVLKAASGISLSQSSMRVGAGIAAGSLTVSFPAKSYARYTASSSNPDVLRVSQSGETISLEPVSGGKAIVTARTATSSDSCLVEVVGIAPSVTLDAPAVIGVDEKGRSASAHFAGDALSAKIHFLSNNPAVLSVDADTGALTANSSGNATIEAYLNYVGDGSDRAAASKVVSVVPAPKSISLDPASLVLRVDELYQIRSEGAGAMIALDSGAHASFSYASSNAGVASVSESGEIKGVKAGDCSITITAQNGTSADLPVKVVKDFTIKATKVELGVGMQASLSASDAPKGASVTYACDPEGALEISPNGSFKALLPGSVTVSAKAGEGENEKVSNAVLVNVLPAPTAAQILFTSESASRVSPYQQNAKVCAVCAPGTMAELGYRIVKAPSGVSIDGATGALTIANSSAGQSFTVEAYDRNNGASAPFTVTIVGSGAFAGLRQSSIQLAVGETYQLSDGPDGIIETGSAGTTGSYKFKSKKPKVASVSDSGLITAKKAGKAKITIASANNKKESGVLTVQVVADSGSAALEPGLLTLGVGMTGKLTPSSATMRFESEDDSIASVDAFGNVSAKAEGDVAITATDAKGRSDTSLVHVVAAPVDVELAYDEIWMGKGEKNMRVSASIVPAEGGEPAGTIEYLLEDDSYKKYLSVNASTGALTAKKKTPEDEPVTVIARVREYPRLSASVDVYVVKKTSLSLTTKTIQLGVGNTYKLRAYIPEEEDEEEYALAYEDEDEEDEEISGIVKLSPEEARANTSFSYKSNKTSIATVSANGLITAKSIGTAKITISTQSKRSATLRVQVCNLPASVSLNKSNLELGEGMTQQLKVSFPANTCDSYSFVSGDEEVAEVDSSGLVTAIGQGETIVTLRTANGLTANCRVAVLPSTEEIHLSAQRSAGTVELSDGDSLTLGVGEKGVKLIATPDEGALAHFGFALAYASDSKKLTVNKTTGVLNAKKVTGDEPVELIVSDAYNEDIQATIYVEILAKPKSKSNLKLSPDAITLCEGATFQISEWSEENESGIIRLAEGYAASYSYKSKDSSVASVSSTGLIRGKKAGKSTTIRISTQNSSVYQDLTVKVVAKPTALRIPPTMRLGSGMTAKIAPEFTPAEASGNLQVTSSDESLLRAEVNAATGEISLTAATIAEKCTATISVRMPDEGLADTCCVTLLPAPKDGEVAFDYENMPAAVRVNGQWVVRIGVNEVGACLAAKCSDSGAMSSFTYRSASTLLSVDSATGELSSRTEGSYTVYATSVSNPSASASATVQVVKAPTAIYFYESEAKPREEELTLRMGVGETYQIAEHRRNELTGEEEGIIVLEPSDSSASYTFAASASKTKTASTGVLSVNKSSGLITAKQEGTAYVKITTQNNKSRILTVKVVPAPSSVYLDPATQSVGENSNGRVTLGFLPEDSSSPVVSYISSDSGLLTMRSDGYFTTSDLRQTGTPETVTITVTTRSGHSASAKVTVLPHPSAVSFDRESYRITEGMSMATAPGSFPAGQMATKFSYASESPEIVAIDPETGVITGVREGSARITITANPGKSYAVSGSAEVIVEPAPARISYEGMGLPEVLKLAKGDVVTIPQPRAYSASGAETQANYSFALKTATDKSYLTIDGDKMTAVKPGKEVVITVSAHNSTAARPVTTELKVAVYDETPAGVDIYFGDRNVNGATLRMYVNKSHPEDSIVLSGKVSGTNVNYGEILFSASGSSLISVSAGGVITVRGDADGKVPSGTEAVITAQSKKGGATASCTIQVGELCEKPELRSTSLTMQEDEKSKIDIAYTPSASGMRMLYASSDAKVVSVDAEGNITAVGGGDATISITGQYGWSGQIAVQVLYNPDEIKLPARKLYMQPGESVVFTPTLSRSGVAPEKINVYTEASSSYDGVVSVSRSAEADQQSGRAASYTISAIGDSDGIAQRVVFTSYNGIEAACEVEVKQGGWDGDPSGFGWDAESDLYMIQGDTAPIEYGLSTSAFNQGGGYEVAPAPGSEEMLQVLPDGSVKALATGAAKLQLIVNGQAPKEVQITVIDPVAPTLWYGEGLTQPVRSEVKLDIGIEGVDPGNHTIRIEKLPINPYGANSVLLGTYNVAIEDETLLEFDRSADRIHTKNATGETKLTVETFGGSVSTLVRILPATTYRALLISEYDGPGNGTPLPFTGSNVRLMKQTLENSSADGANYKGNIVTSSNPTRNQIASLISSTFEGAQEGDVSLIYITAHGHSNGNKGYHFSGYGNIDVTSANLMGWIQKIQGRVVLILDSCHSGAFIADQSSTLSNLGRVAVFAAQEGPRGAAYYEEYKGIQTFEFFTRALCTGLGNPTNVGSADPWKNRTTIADGYSGGAADGMFTLSEVSAAAHDMTVAMVNAYSDPCYGQDPGAAWWNAGKGGLMVGGISADAKKMKNWFDSGKQKPVSHIPEDMRNLAIFTK